MIDKNDFSKSARIKKFIRANKKNFIGLAISFFIVSFLLTVIVVSATTDSDDYLSYENFEKIAIGMSYEEVVEVLDNHIGRSISGSGRGGSVYTWINDSGTCKIIVSFDNKGLVSKKSQSGLD